MLGCFHFVKPCGRQIDHIDKRHAKLEQVPDDVIRNFRTLEECRLDANQIKLLPKNFFRLERIRCLTLSDNQLTKIPSGLGSFSNLVELDLSRNEISELPDSIHFCDCLEIIDISNNPLRSLPTGFCQLRRLRLLYMNDISITQLPDDFGSLHLLEKCELRDNCLKTLPGTFSNLNVLEFLDLGANEFHDFPFALCELTNLTELWLDDNELKSLPKQFCNMKGLQHLNISENIIDSLPEQIGDLEALVDLNLSQNSLNCLPGGIGKLKKLHVLKLNRNQLFSLNPAIGKCSSLQELYLTENFLPSLPPSIGDLGSMYLFNADQNQITELPTQISQCGSLNILSLRENLLRRLPNEIGNCSRLRVLDVSGNKLDRLPVDLARCPLTALWLSANQAQPVMALQRDVDELTQEPFLTCYLLPQDQLDTHTELDPTMSPSDLASFAGPVPTGVTDFINTEQNYAYEPLVSTPYGRSEDDTLRPHSPPPDSLTEKTIPVVPQVSVGECRPDSFVSSTPSSNSVPVDQADTTTASSPDRDRSFPMDGDQSMGFSATSTSSHVHFDAKQDESKEKGVAKSFPKTRHPRLSKKNADNTASREEASSFSHSEDLPPSTYNSGRSLHSPRSPTSPGVAFNAEESVYNPRFPRLSDTKPVESNQRNDGLLSPAEHDAVKSSSEGTTPIPSAKPRSKGLSGPPGTSPGLFSSLTLTQQPESTVRVSDPSSHVSALPTGRRPDEVETTHGISKESIASNVDEDGYSSGGEEICVISRRVGFTDDVDDNEDKSNQKLIRRDTPHYTKRARIQTKTADGIDSEEAVLKILEKYNATAAAAAAADVSNNDSCRAQALGFENLEVDGALRFLSPGSENATLNQRSSTSASIKSGTLQQKQIVITINRPPGSGLGLSIAGGLGSFPYHPSDPGIFVSRLNESGLAYASGLRLNDKLLEVNGISLTNAEHHEAVSALRASTKSFRIVVSREMASSDTAATVNAFVSTPYASSMNTTYATPDTVPEQYKCMILREDGELGFSIVGGWGILPATNAPTPITIAKINENSTSVKNAGIRVGDKLLQVNGISVKDARHDKAAALLSSANPSVELVLQRAAPTLHQQQKPSPTLSANRTPALKANGSVLPFNTGDVPVPKSACSSGAKGLHLVSPTVLAAPQGTTHVRMENGFAVDRVTIHPEGGPLGLAICGGYGTNSLPFGDKEAGIFISKITADGAAQATSLRVGNRLLRVNDIDLRHATHDEAVKALIQPAKVLHLEVRRDPTPPGLRRITIVRRPGECFGLRITGGISSTNLTTSSGTHGSHLPTLPTDGGIFVSWIASDGAVARDGRVSVGDRLLEVNNEWVLGNTLNDTLALFLKAGCALQLTICDGPAEFVQQMNLAQYSSHSNHSSSFLPTTSAISEPISSRFSPAGASVDPLVLGDGRIAEETVARRTGLPSALANNSSQAFRSLVSGLDVPPTSVRLDPAQVQSTSN